jgi:hypothetical protein
VGMRPAGYEAEAGGIPLRGSPDGASFDNSMGFRRGNR